MPRFLELSGEERRTLARVLGEYSQSGLHFPFGEPTTHQQSASPVELVQLVKPPVAGNATDDAGRSAAQLAARLLPGDDTADNPLTAPGYREPITSFAAPSTVTISDAVKDLLAVGISVGLVGTSSDDWYEVRAVAAVSGSMLDVTLDRALPTNTGAGGASLLLPRPWGRTRSESLLSLSLHARSDIVPAIELGTETFPLGILLWRGVLAADLSRATLSGDKSRIIPGTSSLRVLEPNADGELEPSGLVIPIRNYDESLSLAENSLLYAIQRGAWAEPLWGSCVPSGIEVP